MPANTGAWIWLRDSLITHQATLPPVFTLTPPFSCTFITSGGKNISFLMDFHFRLLGNGSVVSHSICNCKTLHEHNVWTGPAASYNCDPFKAWNRQPSAQWAFRLFQSCAELNSLAIWLLLSGPYSASSSKGPGGKQHVITALSDLLESYSFFIEARAVCLD